MNRNKNDQIMRLAKAAGCRHTGRFQLASGLEATEYWDMTPLALNPHTGPQTAALLLNELRDIEAVHVCGVASGGIPLAAQVALLPTQDPGPSISASYATAGRKEHGITGSWHGFRPEAGTSVVLVDDVATTGGTLLAAAEVVREAGYSCNQAIAILGRNRRAEENLAAVGIELRIMAHL